MIQHALLKHLRRSLKRKASPKPRASGGDI